MAKRGTPAHPKTLRLARSLKMPRWAALGLLESTWHWVGRYRPTGVLSPEDLDDCREEVHFDGDLAAVLHSCGWLDELEDGNWYVHDWHMHADDATKQALTKAGLEFGNGSPVRKPKQPEPVVNDSRSARESLANESLQPSLAKPSLAKPSISSASPPPRTDFEPFWDRFFAIYPKRSGDVGKAKGKDKFLHACKSGEDPEAIIDGAKRYRQWCKDTLKIGTEFVKQIPTWLNGRCWQEDYVAPAQPSNGQAHDAQPLKPIRLVKS